MNIAGNLFRNIFKCTYWVYRFPDSHIPILNNIMSSQADEQTKSGQDPDKLDVITRFFVRFGLNTDEENEGKVIADLSFDGLINHWKDKGFKKVVTMVGAGISTSAGIPDFRSPRTGIYNNLKKYKLPDPQAMFCLNYFKTRPEPFVALAKELYPGKYKPTLSHYFVRLLNEKGLLVRHYTQNIDGLERIAGIPPDKIVEAHGTFETNHCIKCRKLHNPEWLRSEIFANRVPHCTTCSGLVKPDIVFFGEDLPVRFYQLQEEDLKNCDLLIIMGTSLEVQPFASLIEKVNARCVRLLINREKVRNRNEPGLHTNGILKYDDVKNRRDIIYLGDCDTGVSILAEAIGWGDELRQLINVKTVRSKQYNSEHQMQDVSANSAKSSKSCNKKEGK